MFLYVSSSTQNASEQFVSSIHLPLQTSLFIQPHKQDCNGLRSGDSNTSIAIIIQNLTNFFSQWPTLSPPTTLTFPPESPCILSPFIVYSRRNLSSCHITAHLCIRLLYTAWNLPTLRAVLTAFNYPVWLHSCDLSCCASCHESCKMLSPLQDAFLRTHYTFIHTFPCI